MRKASWMGRMEAPSLVRSGENPVILVEECNLVSLLSLSSDSQEPQTERITWSLRDVYRGGAECSTLGSAFASTVIRL